MNIKLCNPRVIYKEILVLIMMIEHSIFARSNAILSDRQYYLRRFSEDVLDHMIGDRPYK